MLNKVSQLIRTQSAGFSFFTSSATFGHLAAVGALTLLLSGCGSDKNKSTATPAPQPTPVVSSKTGIWSAPAYGLIFDIKEDNYTAYQTTSDYCLVFNLISVSDVSFDQFIAEIQLSEDKQTAMNTVAGIKIPGILMSREASLPETCVSGLTAQVGDTGYVNQPELDFEIFWQNFNEYYAFFAIEGVNWDDIYQQARSQVDANTSAEALYAVFAEMIEPLKDFHVNLVSDPLDAEYSVSRKENYNDLLLAEYMSQNAIEEFTSQAQFDDYVAYTEQQLGLSYEIIASYTDGDIQSNENGTLLWAKNADNIGYLLINTMDLAELADQGDNKTEQMTALTLTLDQVFTDLAGVNGLIIDIRYNGGGDDFVGQLITSYLIEQDLLAYSKQARLGDSRTPLQSLVITAAADHHYLGKVAVLTSHETSSAAETFSLTLRARGEAVFIGEATGGGLSDILPKTLPNGIGYSISNEIYIGHDGEEFEGTGIPVAIEQPFFTYEQRQAGRDFGVEKAIAWLSQ